MIGRLAEMARGGTFDRATRLADRRDPAYTRRRMWRRVLDPALALVAICTIFVAIWSLRATRAGLRVDVVTIGTLPATVFRPVGFPDALAPAPAIVIAHGFAGSQQLMQPFATTLARNGYVAITFDLPGHGRNSQPLTGDLTREDGATRTLVAAVGEVAVYARGAGNGHLAVLGHSMASDVVVRFAEETPDVTARSRCPCFSPAVTATAPRDLLVIVGDWEPPLKREALRAIGLATAPDVPRAGTTYGDLARGTGRRVAFSPSVEHVGVLYSPASMTEAVAWLDASFGNTRSAPPYADSRGRWLLLLIAGIVMLGRPLSRLLPRVAATPTGGALPWRRAWLPVLAPAALTPLVLRVVPTHFLPVLVGDYLAAHFAVYGAFTFGLLTWSRRTMRRKSEAVSPRRLAIAAGFLTFYCIGIFGYAIDAYITSFVPGAGRWALIGAMLVGTLSYFLADEWLTRGPSAARGVYPATKVAFVVSLVLAVALDFERLLFLVIILPVIVVFFVIYGLFSQWTYRATNSPCASGIANAAAFAWAIAVTFPILPG